MKSILEIRRFFKKREEEEYIDIPSLLRHAFCFGLFLLGAVGFYTSYTIYLLGSHAALQETLLHIYEYCTIFKYSAGFLSQLLLMSIFWSLGRSVEDDMDDEEEPMETEIEEGMEDEDLVFATLGNEEFDTEDADLQAQMWNNLVRTGRPSPSLFGASVKDNNPLAKHVKKYKVGSSLIRSTMSASKVTEDGNFRSSNKSN